MKLNNPYNFDEPVDCSNTSRKNIGVASTLLIDDGASRSYALTREMHDGASRGYARTGGASRGYARTGGASQGYAHCIND